MRLVRRGVYRCTVCDETVFAPVSDARPVARFVDDSERVVTVCDVEVHRCLDTSRNDAQFEVAAALAQAPMAGSFASGSSGQV
jgi:hypothetical protein